MISDKCFIFWNDNFIFCFARIEKILFFMYILDGLESNSSSGTSNRSGPIETTVFSHDPFTEETVKEIESLGFNRIEVIAELRRFNGDKTQATDALFTKSLRL